MFRVKELVRSSKSNYERKLHYNIGEGKSVDSISFDVKQKQKKDKVGNNREDGSYAEFKTSSRRETEKKNNKQVNRQHLKM